MNIKSVENCIFYTYIVPRHAVERYWFASAIRVVAFLDEIGAAVAGMRGWIAEALWVV